MRGQINITPRLFFSLMYPAALGWSVSSTLIGVNSTSATEGSIGSQDGVVQLVTDANPSHFDNPLDPQHDLYLSDSSDDEEQSDADHGSPASDESDTFTRCRQVEDANLTTMTIQCRTTWMSTAYRWSKTT